MRDKLKSTDITAIVGAFNKEVEPIESQLAQKQSRQIEGITFTTGTLHGRKVVVVWTGIGKVNAAMTTTLLLEHFRPHEVIVTGIAGAINPNLRPGDVIIAERTCQHDLGLLTDKGIEHQGVINRLAGERNPVFLRADPRLLQFAEQAAGKVAIDKPSQGADRTPRISKGIIITGDVFVMAVPKRAELRERLGADAVDMEGAAVAQICHQRGIGHIVIKAVSDSADEKAMQDVDVFEKLACSNSATVVVKIVELLGTARQAGRER